ncbi:adenosylmethionine--8-amino-7-oxononanoate transaminase [Allopusillimonas soli]|uniref:Adenosylmethionine-8-amino-7-oxononanoate aminotransferase n=1 Tax=Allopusillimonas soli TaxID=659016 RepID=A0A853F876_9BURK|nr:adenosylmethionine--8-amino-7-oxononanoate transaminase [Allopusillimonas soli]NYT36834.1 adenosylmethionine--8-amino-7-oxononanoate transaminase [Allopusillimonas soli]TEA75296.1 adenosylmethionine--8-amino-7-oxononanoate transaminase [Allopusillimonas soli]
MNEPSWMTAGYPHIWLPYAQMKTVSAPPQVVRTRGSRIELADGRSLIDGVASWWTACHGYNHPHIADAIRIQLEQMPHVMLGGLVHEQALTLAHRLCKLLGAGMERVFFTESGSVSVEVAVKMAMQYWFNQGEVQRKQVLAFRHGYHGDTFGTMALCDPEVGMHAAFRSVLPGHTALPLPIDEDETAALRAWLQAHGSQLAAMIVEPLVQGAGGMRMHDPAVLRTLRQLADQHGILLIFDEIFTGFGRTGSMFAFEQADVQPDIITLSKALTGGTLPLAATVAKRHIFEAFWSDDPSHALMHGPTFMGNALACAAANASLDLFEHEPRLRQAQEISNALRESLAPCSELPVVRDVRVLGAIGAVELSRSVDLAALRRQFIDAGTWIRPFGNVVYLTPSLTINAQDLAYLASTIHDVLATLDARDC